MNGSISEKRRPNRLWMWWLVILLVAVGATGLILKTNGKRDAEFTVSPSFVNLDENLSISNTEQPTIHIVVSGPPSTIQRILPTAILCQLDLTGLHQGTHTIPLAKAMIVLPEGVTLSRLITTSIRLTVEKKHPVKEVDVVAVLEGQPAPGYTVADIILHPNSIVLKGPASKLAAIETVKTRPIGLEAASESFKKEIPLDLPEAVSVNPSTGLVIAQIDVRERIVTRVIEHLPVSGKGLSSGYRIVPGQIDLTVSGPEGVVKAIETDPAFAATVDLAEYTSGRHVLKATINLPVQVKLIRADPEQFEVEITAE